MHKASIIVVMILGMVSGQALADDFGPRWGWRQGSGPGMMQRLGAIDTKYNEGVPADSRMNLPGYEWLKEKLSSDAGRAQLAQVRELAKLADEIGISMTHLALLWCLANKNVSTVILGASRTSQLEDNLAALSHKDRLTAEVLKRIDTIAANKPPEPRRF